MPNIKEKIDEILNEGKEISSHLVTGRLSCLYFDKWLKDSLLKLAEEVADQFIQTLENMPIEKVGDSGHTLHQAIQDLESKRKELGI